MNILLALDFIHSEGYIFRDIKPENMMIMENGYLKIIDFGFAKKVPYNGEGENLMHRTYTLCGTPEYMAPEIILTHGHDKTADYWAFGIFIYEILYGYTPFSSRSRQKTFQKIVNCAKHIYFAGGSDIHAKVLIRQLLHISPPMRLGTISKGLLHLTLTPFLTMNSDKLKSLYKMQYRMPFQPNGAFSSASEGNLREALSAKKYFEDIESSTLPLSAQEEQAYEFFGP